MEAGLRVIRMSRVGRDGYLYWRKGKLTSERVQGVINARVAELGGIAAHTIVASGNQACDPHEVGHGPLRAHRPIILDIFPRDGRTGYWGDITRTVVRGRASEKVRDIYATVAKGQELAFAKLREGVNGRDVHQAVCDLFNQRGFKTGRKKGRMQGFFHGTGHGLGLEIHEPPRVSAVDVTMKAGMVVTVEPGLYYPGIGGVRLEDVAVITKTGARNLTKFPKFLEI
jgi:Xaa-Pro aminopeptidase